MLAVARGDRTRNADPVTIDDMEVGMREAYLVVIDQEMIDACAELASDFNPIHVDAEYTAGTRFGVPIAHGMLTAGFVQHALTALTTPGGISTGYTFRLPAPVPAGDEVEAVAGCVAVDRERRRATFALTVTALGEHGGPVIEGEAEIALPRDRE